MDTNNRGSSTTTADNSSPYPAPHVYVYYVGDSSESEEEDRAITVEDSSDSEEENRTTTTEDEDEDEDEEEEEEEEDHAITVEDSSDSEEENRTTPTEDEDEDEDHAITVEDSSDSEEEGHAITIGDSEDSEDEDRTTTTEDSSDSEEEDRAITIGSLVGVTSVDGLLKRLRKRLKPMEQVIASIKAQQGDDDEVQAGPIRLSLRDPFTYTRISLPCRASSCVHIGCFDAMCWYAMMEQTSIRLCPLCDRVLDPDELIIDGFVSDILAKVHKDVDNVIIEPDGEWHTEDRTAGSVSWMQKYGATKASKALQRPKRTVPLPPSTTPSGPSTITIGDSSESEEEVREVKRRLSSPPVTIPARRPAAPEVIDLTLSDSDEDPAVRPAAPGAIERAFRAMVASILRHSDI